MRPLFELNKQSVMPLCLVALEEGQDVFLGQVSVWRTCHPGKTVLMVIKKKVPGWAEYTGLPSSNDFLRV